MSIQFTPNLDLELPTPSTSGLVNIYNNNMQTLDLGYQIPYVAGETIARYQYLYVDPTTNFVHPAASGTSTTELIGMALAAGASGASVQVLIGPGNITNVAWNWAHPGQFLYLSTAGGLTQTSTSVAVGLATGTSGALIFGPTRAVSGAITEVVSANGAIAVSSMFGPIVTLTVPLIGGALATVGFFVAPVYIGAGNPGSGTLTAGNYYIAQTYWDTVHNAPWWCSVSGTQNVGAAGGSTWVSGGSGGGSAPTMYVAKGTANNSDYSTTNTGSYVTVDNTHLTLTITVPTGQTLWIVATGTVESTHVADCLFGIADGSSILNHATGPSVASNDQQITLQAQITGDNASHTITLQFQSADGNGVLIRNRNEASSFGSAPVISAMLT